MAILVMVLLFFFRSFGIQMLTPLLRISSRAGEIISVALTSEQQRVLEKRIISLAIDQAEFDAIRAENETLRKELGFIARTGFSALPASVLSKSLSGTVSRFVVDIGADEGVQDGDTVIAEDGLLVGTVVETQKKTATVLYLTDPTHTTAVSLLNDRRTIGVAYGSSSRLLEIRFIPADEIIEVNDLVVSSGLEETVPSGLLIGIVNAVEQDSSTLFLTAVVEPLQDIRRLMHVLVLTRSAL